MKTYLNLWQFFEFLEFKKASENTKAHILSHIYFTETDWYKLNIYNKYGTAREAKESFG